MKLITTLIILTATLTACTSSTPAPAPQLNVTGKWSATFSNPTNGAALALIFELNDQSGVLTGKAYGAIDPTNFVNVSGSRSTANQGTLNFAVSPYAFSLTGTFTEKTFSGKVFVASGGQTGEANATMEKVQ